MPNSCTFVAKGRQETHLRHTSTANAKSPGSGWMAKRRASGDVTGVTQRIPLFVQVLVK